MARNAQELVNLPVLTTSTGKEMGTVARVIFVPGEHRIYGFLVKPDDKHEPQLIVRTENTKSMGHQAITIEDETAAVAFDADPTARELVAAGGYFSGMPIVTVSGEQLGKVDTVFINDDGSIASYRTAGGMLGLGSGRDFSIDQVVSAGEDAIIVSDGDESA